MADAASRSKLKIVDELCRVMGHEAEQVKLPSRAVRFIECVVNCVADLERRRRRKRARDDPWLGSGRRHVQARHAISERMPWTSLSWQWGRSTAAVWRPWCSAAVVLAGNEQHSSGDASLSMRRQSWCKPGRSPGKDGITAGPKPSAAGSPPPRSSVAAGIRSRCARRAYSTVATRRMTHGGVAATYDGLRNHRRRHQRACRPVGICEPRRVTRSESSSPLRLVEGGLIRQESASVG